MWELVGRGDLNLNHNFLIFNDIYGLSFVVEYHLEYRFPKRYFAWDSNLRPSRMLDLSANLTHALRGGTSNAAVTKMAIS